MELKSLGLGFTVQKIMREYYIYKILDTETGEFRCQRFSSFDENGQYEFDSIEEARKAGAPGAYKDKKRYKIQKYKRVIEEIPVDFEESERESTWEEDLAQEREALKKENEWDDEDVDCYLQMRKDLENSLVEIMNNDRKNAFYKK